MTRLRETPDIANSPYPPRLPRPAPKRWETRPSLDDSNISDPLEFSSHKGRLLVVHNDAKTPFQQEVLRSAEQFWADTGIEHHTYNELERAPQLALAS